MKGVRCNSTFFSLTILHIALHTKQEEVDYSRRGPGAYQALASGKVPSSFRGLPVYTSYPLDTDFNGKSALV